MAQLLMVAIRLYWVLIPARKRKPCLFKISCSDYVFQETKEKGFWKGVRALFGRYHSCRPGYHLFQDNTDERKKIMLANGEVMEADRIAERLLKAFETAK